MMELCKMLTLYTYLIKPFQLIISFPLNIECQFSFLYLKKGSIFKFLFNTVRF